MSEGKNCDAGKLRVDLVAPEIVEALARVCGEGRGLDKDGNPKYEDRNWEKGMDWMRQYGSALRHLLKWAKGEDIDEESGCSHLEHALWRIGALVTYAKRGIGVDDRSSGEGTMANNKSLEFEPPTDCQALYSHSPATPVVLCGGFSKQLDRIWWCRTHKRQVPLSAKPFDYGRGQF